MTDTIVLKERHENYNSNSVKNKRPYLRKRQGVAAWSYRLRQMRSPRNETQSLSNKKPDGCRTDSKITKQNNSTNIQKPDNARSASNDRRGGKINCQSNPPPPTHTVNSPTKNPHPDLDEFERLEEMIEETSSVSSSVSNSFVANLTDCLLRQQQQPRENTPVVGDENYQGSKFEPSILGSLDQTLAIHSTVTTESLPTPPSYNNRPVTTVNDLAYSPTHYHNSTLDNNGQTSRMTATNLNGCDAKRPSRKVARFSFDSHIVDTRDNIVAGDHHHKKVEEAADPNQDDDEYHILSHMDNEVVEFDDSVSWNSSISSSEHRHLELGEEKISHDDAFQPSSTRSTNHQDQPITGGGGGIGLPTDAPAGDSLDIKTANLSDSQPTQQALQVWINRLEAEVNRFKQENANLIKAKQEFQERSRCLEQEEKRLNQTKTNLASKVDEEKEAELRKIKKERKVFEEYHRVLKSMPNKHDREEIERLQSELEECRLDLGRREMRWQSTVNRMKSRQAELEAERDQFKTRLERVEQDRVALQAQLTDLRWNSGGGNNRPSRSSSLSQKINAISQSIELKPPPIGSNRPSRSSSRDLPRSSDLPVVISSRSIPTHSDMRHQSYANTRQNRSSNADDDAVSIDSGFGGGGGGQASNRHQPLVSNNELRRSSLSVDNARHEPSGRQFDCRDDDRLAFDHTLDEEALPMPGTAASGALVKTIRNADGSLEETFENNAVVIAFTNGSIKEIFPDGTSVVSLFNGDIKRTLTDGRVVYHYSTDGTVQITYPDGTEVTKYRNPISTKVLESDLQPPQYCDSDTPSTYTHSFSGRQDIKYPPPCSNSSRLAKQPVSMVTPSPLSPNSDDRLRQLANGDQELLLANGQRELHCRSGVKRRIYPDGTTKTLYPDGRQETRYASGRLRVKDASGQLIIDQRLTNNNAVVGDAISPSSASTCQS